jgi:ABC-type glycerol-3-phosphate transport system substrate-binding protein
MKRVFLVMLGLVMVAGILFAGAQGEAAKVHIKWAHYFDPLQSPAAQANANWLKKVIADFEKENPNIKVDPELFQWDQIDNRSILDFQAGVKHDVIFGSPQLMAKHFSIGDYLDIAPYIAKWSDAEKKDFSWSPVWASAKNGDKQYGIPTGVHTRALVVRRDLFKEIGVDPDKGEMSWDEMVEIAQKLTKDGMYGLGNFFGASRATIELVFGPLIWHFGGELWDPHTKKATFASTAGVQAAQLAYDTVFKYKITPESAVGGAYEDGVFKPFMEGKAAMAWGWGSYWIQALEDKGMIKSCFPPSKDCTPGTAGVFVTPTKPKAQFTNAWTISVHKLSEHPAESFKLIEYVLKADNLAVFGDAGIPARLSTWSKPEMQSAFWQTWLTAAKNGRGMPATVYYPELADAISAAFQQIIANNAPIAETLQKAEDEWNGKYAGK